MTPELRAVNTLIACPRCDHETLVSGLDPRDRFTCWFCCHVVIIPVTSRRDRIEQAIGLYHARIACGNPPEETLAEFIDAALGLTD
jgi:transcription elongation factor Elf1